MRKKQRAPKWKKALGAAWYVAFCCLALALGTGAAWVRQSPYLFSWLQQKVFNTRPEDVFNSDHLTLLVLGCDEDRAYGGKKILKEAARSDMILVARIDFKLKRIGGISIPRDLLVELPGYKLQKINAYHTIGGKELSQKAVESVIQIPIDRAMVINYEAFKELVDLIGGVEIYVDKKMVWTDKRGDLYINLKPGRQVLDGYQAMGFVRFRHSDSDYARMHRQRDFLLALKEAVFEKPSLLPSVINKAAEATGSDLSAPEMAALGNFVTKVGSDNIKLGALPVIEIENYNLLVDSSNLKKTLEDNYLLPVPASAARMTYK